MAQTLDPKEDIPHPNLPLPSTSALGLTRTYAREWTSAHAFREFYQNWKDAIIQSYNLKSMDFNPDLADKKDEILITIHRHSPTGLVEDCMGYIRFKKETGTVEFTNFGAILARNCLEMGYSTKTEDARLAGRYGEGLKVAALVMRRNGYHVRICSNSRFWNFGFRGKSKNEFYYQLNRASESRVHTLRTAFNNAHESGTARKMSPNIWEDVSVTVGQIRGHGQPVDLDTFANWLEVTIDLHHPCKLVCTLYGKLILDPAYAGQLYVKGLRVTLADCRETQYRYGYDFLTPDMSPNRDRRLEVHPEREAKAVAAIWEAAIRQDQDVIHIYTDLLKLDNSADVAFADTNITEATAQKVWACLGADARKDGLFYFPAGYEADNVQLIRHELKYEPIPLPYSLWKLLRKYGLAKLPFEEIYHQFQQSREVEPPATLFAQETSRAFGALFGRHAPDKETRIVYVHFADNLPNMAFSKEHNILYVHEKWLDSGRAHGTSPCEMSEVGVILTDMFCDHIVDDMFKSAILAVRRPIDPPYNFMVKDVQSLQSLVRNCKGKTREMAFNVQVAAAKSTNSLRVTWSDSYSRAFAETFRSLVEYIVVLHGAACILEAQRLWYRENSITCDCPRQIVQLAPNGMENVAVFESLDDKPRFPMVARFRQSSAEPSLWALPPPPISPINTSAEGILDETTLDGRENDVESDEGSEAYSPVLEVPQIMHHDSERLHELSEDTVAMVVTYEQYAERTAVCKAQSLAGVRAISQVRSGQYLRVPTDSSLFWILYVHEVLYEDHCARLLVTKYSSYSSLLQSDGIPEAVQQKELLLHFNDFHHMGKMEDADWVTTDDLPDLSSTEISVHHGTEKPGKLNGNSHTNYFCRFAIRNTDDLTNCSLLPLRTQVPNMTGKYKVPVLSALPAPMVIDFSPRDIGLSVGFKRAGCHIERGVGESDIHPLWQTQNPDARIAKDVDEGLHAPEQILNPRMSSIAIISSAIPTKPGDSSANSLASAMDTCRRVAQHTNRTDFILLAIHYASWVECASSSLKDVISCLLEAQYSVHVRLHTVSAGLPEDSPALFVLAAPFCTNPQYLDDILGDINHARMGAEVSFNTHDPVAIAATKGFDDSIAGALNPSNYEQVIQGVSPIFAHQIATAAGYFFVPFNSYISSAIYVFFTLPGHLAMDKETLRTIRSIGRQRAMNSYYKTCYVLLRLLEKLIISAEKELLSLSKSESDDDFCYDAAAKVAIRIHKATREFKKLKADAMSAWLTLQRASRTESMVDS
ncbi:hypothetical protein TSTA_062120 [Talaromyces stipitatus ATCC 10500]|uniref:Uncharacterized protein n=1 Tax=Talaromyces stipitatus (strain ATCC 10500 / CBS 375.48 / QM 6759 / NRRL 1006) TaxID=441959 RepID=B8LX74_TALSN|nr:uncharacterized protein TSTA_062120 [Talaromyces stipitatus ATCC 10500]EED22724.1 hypothetical protein TSTA_062120 [Talaromyces stipitatus ATCC 10500]